MASLIVSMNLSLDGFVEAPEPDDGSWLNIDQEVHTAFNQLATEADTFLYGRKVFEVMIPYWPDAAKDSSRPSYEHEYGKIWVEKPKLVVSSSLQQSEWNTRVIASNLADEITQLKQRAKSYVLCYGGPELVAALEAKRLVDEYALYVHPSVVGSGRPFFQGPATLRLKDVRRFGNGTLGLRYARPA
jgi:dihydrofolate reductase